MADLTPDEREARRVERRRQIEEEMRVFEEDMKRKSEERARQREQRRKEQADEEARLAAELEERRKRREQQRAALGLEPTTPAAPPASATTPASSTSTAAAPSVAVPSTTAAPTATPLSPRGAAVDPAEERRRARELRRKQMEEETARAEEERQRKLRERLAAAEERRLKEEEAIQAAARKREEERRKRDEERAKQLAEEDTKRRAAEQEAAAKRQAVLDLLAAEAKKKEEEALARQRQREQEREERERAKREQEQREQAERAAREAALSAEKKYADVLTQARALPQVPFPAVSRLDALHVFTRSASTLPDAELIRAHFLNEGRLTNECAIELINRARAILTKEPNVVDVTLPAVVVGDIHGQFFDLCALIDKAGTPGFTQYVFLGDYVDRGYFSCEVVLYLLALKLNFPQHVWLLRGNHESRGMTNHFNFRSETLHKYSEGVYAALMGAFDALPIAALMTAAIGTDRYLCMHGGIGPELKTIDDIRNKIIRAAEPPENGAYCDLLWSDPIDESRMKGWSDTQFCGIEWRENKLRGCGTVYGYMAVARFLRENNLTALVRAHEVKKHGYEEHKFRQPNAMVITVFSAPNYCDNHENWAAFVRFEASGTYAFEQIAWTSHPYHLPNFMNVFQYSMPFIAEAFSKFFLAVLQVCEEQEDEAAETSPTTPTDSATDADADKLGQQRLKSVAKTMIEAKKLREEHQTILSELNASQLAEDVFEAARQRDEKYERRPPSWNTMRNAFKAKLGLLSRLSREPGTTAATPPTSNADSTQAGGV